MIKRLSAFVKDGAESFVSEFETFTTASFASELENVTLVSFSHKTEIPEINELP